MCSRISSLCVAAAMLLAASSAIAQDSRPAPPTFASLAPIAFSTSGPVLRAPAQTEKPFTVAGERGVLLGRQNGTLEAWVLPVKLLSHLTIEASIQGYTVPIDVNQQAASIEVRPDRTIITYAHIGFTVRQIMFSPNAGAGPAHTGPVVLFEFDCLHPTDFTLRFTPNLEWMWPERNEGNPGVEWVSPDPRNPAAAGGYYVLHSDYPDLAGAITIPGAEPGILAPYQERPQVHPVELKLHIDPARDRGKLFPLLMAVGMDTPSAANAALGATLAQLNDQIPALYQAHSASYQKLLADSVSIDTPDKSLDEAFRWAEISIEQLKAHPVDKDDTPTDETALVAGYYASGDSARPGFGWFFGRDALYTLYAVNGFGDFALTRNELEFLIHRQRADGKIMHEYSQTAAAIDWQQFPYEYAAADSTPLFLLAVADYVRSSGDTAFLRQHRDAIEKAWAFETDPAHDADHDGIYDNSQGTGWVESWPGGMPHQEIYLALLDQQASTAMAYIEHQLSDSPKAEAAEHRAQTLIKTINSEYYDAQKGCYAFATNPAGTANSPVDRTTTVYPALAWWDPQSSKPILDHPDACLQQFVGSALNTDWGTRDVSNEEKIYDGMSYHQGSVWPLFTGWAALAEYRGGQPLAGYQLLKENANLTRAQDLGADTELLSGDFFIPFGRSTSHQLWSSAMVITPTLRGLFGISIDAPTKTITVNPHLPASWNHADVIHLPVEDGNLDLTFNRHPDYWEVFLGGSAVSTWHIRTSSPGTNLNTQVPGVRVSIPPVQLDESAEIPQPGSRSVHARIVNETWRADSASFVFEGPAGSNASYDLVGIDRVPHLKVESPENMGRDAQSWNQDLAVYVVPCKNPCEATEMGLHFPPGTGWKTLTVTLTW